MRIDEEIRVLEKIPGLHIGIRVRHCALPATGIPVTVSSSAGTQGRSGIPIHSNGNCEISSAPIHTLRIAGEELLPVITIEISSQRGVRGVELIEGAVPAIRREVTAEEAPVDPELLEGVRDPRLEDLRIGGSERHGQAGKLAVDIGTERSESGDSGFPHFELVVRVRSWPAGVFEIGRASCRERVPTSVVAIS